LDIAILLIEREITQPKLGESQRGRRFRSPPPKLVVQVLGKAKLQVRVLHGVKRLDLLSSEVIDVVLTFVASCSDPVAQTAVG